MMTTDQQTVVKGGSICVFGGVEKGIQWGNLGADYLVSKFSSSSRYSKIICLNLDRNQDDLVSIANYQNTRPDGNGKLQFVKCQHHEMNVSNILRNLDTSLNEISPNSAFAVVIYSLSELVLLLGLKQAVCFAQKVVEMTQKKLAEPTITLDNSKTSVIMNSAVVFVVHESLHSLQAINRLQLLASTVMRVVPNSGTLSPEVLAEIQTVRKSPSTGKVSETLEMFSCRDAMLWPIPASAPVAVTSEEVVDHALGGNSVLSKLLTTGEASSASLSSPVIPAAVFNSNSTARLITFDSTDPEFDNDSDPDADLDL